MRKSHLVILGFIITMLAAGNARIVAQQSGTAVLFTPVGGTVNNGSTFSGTFLIQRFESRNNGAVAFGNVTGLMTTPNGVSRTVVTQVAIPIAISSGNATVATTPGVSPSSCGGVHLDLAAAAFQVLGSTVRLDQSALDITTAQPDTTTSITQSSGFGVATGLSSIPVTTNLSPANVSSPNAVNTMIAGPSGTNTTLGASATTTLGTSATTSVASGSAPTTTSVIGPLGQPVNVPSSLTSIGTLNPGIATPVQNTPATPVGSSPQFQQLVCSAGALSQTASSGAQVVQMLNQMLATMGG